MVNKLLVNTADEIDKRTSLGENPNAHYRVLKKGDLYIFKHNVYRVFGKVTVLIFEITAHWVEPKMIAKQRTSIILTYQF